MSMFQRACGTSDPVFKDCRRNDRIVAQHNGKLATPFWQVDCVVKDLSESGAKLVSRQRPSKGDEVTVRVPRAGCAQAKVKWLEDGVIGVEFLREPGCLNQISERFNRLSVRTFLNQNSCWH